MNTYKVSVKLQNGLIRNITVSTSSESIACDHALWDSPGAEIVAVAMVK